MRYYFYKILRIGFFLGLFFLLTAAVLASVVRWYFLPQLPSTDMIKEVNLQAPLRVYTREGLLIGEFGEMRRIPLPLKQIPPLMIEAILAAEDKSYFEHAGVNVKSLIRAALNLLKTGKKEQGGSTVTMQMVRNYFLPEEKGKKWYTRKIKEILLALKIEQELTKEDILELYLNKIFFGQRAYGIGAAAQTYYGRDLQNLTLAEWATLAGLPKAPSVNNPIDNPGEALGRRDYILKRMLDLGKINQQQYQEAIKAGNTAHLFRLPIETDAPYIAEMVRNYMVKRFTESAYTKGFRVITTIESHLQETAQIALRNTLWAYDERHGYRKPLAHIKLNTVNKKYDDILKDYPRRGGLLPSIVLEVKGRSVTAYNQAIGTFEMGWNDLAWARRYIHDKKQGSAPNSASEIVTVGDIILVRGVLQKSPLKTTPENSKLKTENTKEDSDSQVVRRWRLAEIPQVEGALVSLRPEDGAIVALVGGFDFYQSKFNRVTQAIRQPGSSFKPFIYSAALERGFTPASVINDAPLPLGVWQPLNYSQKFYGPTTLRKALALSRNLVAVRLLLKVGVDPTIDYLTRFGFDPKNIPRNLTIALGSSDVKPLEMVRGFAVFANGGYLVEPYFIERIEDSEGRTIEVARPTKVCSECPPLSFEPPKGSLLKTTLVTSSEATQDQEASLCIACPPPEGLEATASATPRLAPLAIRPQNAWVMTSLLKDVISYGTAQAAKVLNRSDLAGKTGTTNDERDAWFIGYNPDLVTAAWVGFDQPRSLGYKEAGGRTALPMWIEFMAEALKDKAIKNLKPPTGLTTARIDPKSGLLANSGESDSELEVFFKETVPKQKAPRRDSATKISKEPGKSNESTMIPEQLW